MSQVTFTIIFLAFLTAGFFAWYFFHKTREKERLMLIEKGFYLPQENSERKFSFRFPQLKMGFVVTGLSLGLLIGNMLSELDIIRQGIEPIMMFLFGGIGMIFAHFVDRNPK